VPAIKSPRYKEFLAIIRERLPAKKASHCVFVAEYLASFAESVGLDHDRAVMAGMLHDLCRCLSKDELLARARGYSLNLDEAYLGNPVLLHGPVAAEECRRELAIEDEDVYEAIFWHSTGRPKWNHLGQALYVADFAEPTRHYPEAAEVRNTLRKHGFEQALLLAAETKAAYGAEKHADNPDAKAFLWWLRQDNA